MSFPPRPAAPPAAAAPDAAARVRGRVMAQSLGLLLDKARGAREVLPHLAALERALLDSGTEAVAKVPEHWLQRICSQLSSLPLPEQDAPLHDLLQLLMGRLQNNPESGESWLDAPGAGFHPDRTVVIREISHTEFEAASEEMATTMQMTLQAR